MKQNHDVLLVSRGYMELSLECICGWSEFLGGSVKPEWALKLTDQHYRGKTTKAPYSGVRDDSKEQ